MTKTEIAEFSASDFNSTDVAHMTVQVGGKLTDWVWTFAGPGHKQTIDQSNRIARERLHQDRQNEQQRLNGKKVKLPEETPDELRDRTIGWVVGRLVDWSPVKIDGEVVPFSPENARKLLSDRKNVELFSQAADFLSDDAAFTKRSAET